MLEDSERTTVFLGIAGAMVPAGMQGVLSTMIRRNMVDVVVSTGANMYHDLVEALGEHHYLGSPYADDRILHEDGVDRIFDTYADEKKYRMIDRKIMFLADELAEQKSNPVSSRFFLNRLGEFVDVRGSSADKKTSIIWNCWKNEVPIFVPALSDSAIGLALTSHHMRFVKEKKRPFVINEIIDNNEIFEIKKKSSKSGVVYVGGGVPKNYINQTAYLQDMFGIPDSGHDYGIQITTDSPQWGGLSGCTFREAMSWGKVKLKAKFATCYCDTTIALPLVVKAALERCKNLKKRGLLHLKFLQEN
jgi:deoxyhypusine synthase